MECLIDFTDDNVQYATYANGQITRTLDHWINDRKDIEPKDDQGNSLSGAWITPYIIHPDNSKFLDAGYQDIYKSENRGDTWTKISSINTSNNFRTMAVCEYASNNIYAADQTQLWKSSDGGVNWVSKSSNLPTGLNSYILSIAVKSDDPNILWITLSGFQHDGVYESTNGGDTWTSISTGLPQIPIYTIVYNKLEKSRNDLYIGTEVGVFYKAGSAGWIYYSHGLPNVFVDELEIFYDKNNPEQSKLIAATYGRGLWEAPLVSSGNFVPELTQAAVSNLTSNSATFTASINNDYGNAVIQSGFVYSSSEYPVLGTSGSVKILTSPAATIGQFSIDAHGLTFPFYVRPFAVNSNGVGYGKAKAYDKNGSPLVVEDIEKYGIKIYPNPTEGDISIQFDQLWGNMMVSVLNMAGKTIETKKVDSKLMKFYLNKQAKGIYMIEISWPGNRLTSKVLFN